MQLPDIRTFHSSPSSSVFSRAVCSPLSTLISLCEIWELGILRIQSELFFASRSVKNYLFILQSISEMLRLNAPMAMKSALEGLKDSEYKTRDTAINDVGGYETIELSVLLCNDEFIRKLNKEWRDEDHATDVLSMSEHIPELELPIVSNLKIYNLVNCSRSMKN